MLSVLVSTRFQVLFHSPPGVLFTFPSQYYYTIGHWVVFRLGGWSPRIPTGFHVSGGTLDTAWLTQLFVYRTLTFSGLLSHTIQLNSFNAMSQSEPHKYFYSWFSLFRVRSPLLTESRLISLPRPT